MKCPSHHFVRSEGKNVQLLAWVSGAMMVFSLVLVDSVGDPLRRDHLCNLLAVECVFGVISLLDSE